MNGADLAIAVIVLASMLVGVIRGLVVEVLSIATWLAAGVLSAWFGPTLADAMETQLETASLRVFLAYALVFVGTLLAGALILWLSRKLVEGTGLSGTDRMLGLLFGAVRGVGLCVLLVLVAGLTPMPRDAWWRESRALPWFVTLAEAALRAVPERLAMHVRLHPLPIVGDSPEGASPPASPTPVET